MPDYRMGNVRGGVPVVCPVPKLPASRNLAFDPQHVLIMLTAFESACANLRLRKGDEMTDRVALKIVDLANAGERDTDRLLALVLLEFEAGQGSRFNHSTRQTPAVGSSLNVASQTR
jgi:hypothetical protein